MQIGEKGLNLIKSFEGCILQSYDDANDKIVNPGDTVRGTLTIGWGHTEGVYKGQKITQDEANRILAEDMVRYANDAYRIICNANVPFELTQDMFDALVSFHYNCGCLAQLLQNGTRDKQTVADKMLEYINPPQFREGLLRRRTAERALFLDGQGTSINTTSCSDNWVARFQRECNVQGFSNQAVDGIPGVNTLKGCPTLHYGAKGNITKLLQEKLSSLGYDTNGVDGIYGSGTSNAVKQFERDNSLSIDDGHGIAGKEVWGCLIYK